MKEEGWGWWMCRWESGVLVGLAYCGLIMKPFGQVNMKMGKWGIL